MSQHASNDTWRKQQQKIVRATFKKAFIVAIHSASSTVDVYFVENPQTVIKSIPLASVINPLLVRVGDRCRVDVFDETNPSDMVVAYVYGRTFSFGDVSTKVFFKTGSGFFPNGTTFNTTIVHGLVDNDGVALVPDFAIVQVGSDAWYGPTPIYVDLYAYTWNATVINVGSTITPSPISVSYNWIALKFQ